MKKRRGLSLIELAVVMTAATAIMAVAVGLLHTLMEFERTGRDEQRASTVFARLADQFRRDIHRAGELTAAAGPAGQESRVWELSLGEDGRVEYRVEGAHLMRIESVGGKVVGRESYRLPAGAAASIQRLEETGAGLVRLEITPGAVDVGRLWLGGLRVDAMLAKDRRFAGENES